MEGNIYSQLYGGDEGDENRRLLDLMSAWQQSYKDTAGVFKQKRLEKEKEEAEDQAMMIQGVSSIPGAYSFGKEIITDIKEAKKKPQTNSKVNKASTSKPGEFKLWDKSKSLKGKDFGLDKAMGYASVAGGAAETISALKKGKVKFEDVDDLLLSLAMFTPAAPAANILSWGKRIGEMFKLW